VIKLPKISETLEEKLATANGKSKLDVVIFGVCYNFRGYKEMGNGKRYFHFYRSGILGLNKTLDELKKQRIDHSVPQRDFGFVQVTKMTKGQVEYFAEQGYVGTMLSKDDNIWLG
jgi:hypothetical protein